MSACYFDQEKRFVIEDFDTFPPFASFLPGIAGALGIPLWAFYVNRGQAIASFGVESKDTPIMEFQPANKAYQTTPYTGFRTFLKVLRPAVERSGEAAGLLNGAGRRFYEPFSALVRPAPARWMSIGANELELEERSTLNGLQVNVLYFTLPGENFAGLVRQVTVKNIADQPAELELLDGLPVVIPYGLSDALLKQINRTAEAWMAVFDLEAGIPFYRVQASVTDSAEVGTVKAGHFYLAFAEAGGQTQLLRPIVDPAVVFGANTSLSYPDRFAAQPLAELQAERQITVGRTPCGLFGAAATLASGEALTVYGLIGHAGQPDIVQQARGRLAQPAAIAAKRAEAQALAQALTDPVATQTSQPRFDAYCRQSLLDNILRGGWPVQLGGHTVHLYGRKHGDLERDYNAFHLAPEFYAQGNANYRDVNQNRRSDVLLSPEVGDGEILAFLGLLQADGYNPLVVTGSRFTVPPERQDALGALLRRPEDLARLRPLLAQPFTPGQLLKAAAGQDIELAVAPQAFVEAVLAQAGQTFEATFGEGYWVDHWTYNLDLLETYLAIFPEKKDELLFGKPVVPFYDSAAIVQPRNRKHVLTDRGVRQYGAVLEDEEKAALIAGRREAPHLMRTAHGQGGVYRTTVFAKLLALAVVKFATLDPLGMGIEMEAGKPGWNDSLNGLPGLLGSSLCETLELQRLLDFLLAAMAQQGGGSVDLPVELAALLHEVESGLADFHAGANERRDFRYWDAVAGAREAYRSAVRLGFDGATETLDFDALAPVVRAFRDKVAAGVARAEALNGGIPPTYFTYQATAYEFTPDRVGLPLRDAQGRPFVQVLDVTPCLLPLFLEGPMHAMKLRRNAAGAGELYRQVKNSGLFDAELGMYRVNTSLAAQSHEIGRARAFTPGWLENESVFLHLAYKYLLEVLRAGLFEEFFEDLKRGGVPFFDPQIYGRSPLENSSFIVSSAHPDPSVHGRGFVARLTGATAEFLSICSLMMAGPQPFCMVDGELRLALRPALPGWLFREDGTLSFTFLGRCTVTYHNALRRDTFAPGMAVRTVVVHLDDGERVVVRGGEVGAPYAGLIREGRAPRLDVYFDWVR